MPLVIRRCHSHLRDSEYAAPSLRIHRARAALAARTVIEILLYQFIVDHAPSLSLSLSNLTRISIRRPLPCSRCSRWPRLRIFRRRDPLIEPTAIVHRLRLFVTDIKHRGARDFSLLFLSLSLSLRLRVEASLLRINFRVR